MTKRSDTLIVNEFLAFVQNKLDVMDELSLEQICTSSYTEADILSAKKILAETAAAGTAFRLTTRQKDGNGKKDLRDMFRFFKEIDPDDIPTYVARDLSILPPVTFDHVDVTSLLKDILVLKNEVTAIKKKLEISDQIVTDLKKELAMRSDNNAVPTISPSVSYVNTRRGGDIRNRCIDVLPLSPEFASPAESSRVNDRSVNTQSPCAVKRTPTQPMKPAASSAKTQPPALQKKSYAQASRVLKPNPAPTTSGTTLKMHDMNKVDNDGFTTVEKKKRRLRPSRNQRGTAPLTASTLRAVEPTVSIYLSRLNPETSGDEVLKYIKETLHGRIQGQIAMRLSRLESTRTTEFKSYRLQVPAVHKELFLNSDFWPVGVVYRRYREGAKFLNPVK